jgi:hypothetical protein
MSTYHEKIPDGGWLLWCGTGGMFTIMWARGLLLVGNVTRQRRTLLHYYALTENVKQLGAGCIECTFAV